MLSLISRRLETKGRTLALSMIICTYFYFSLAHPAGVITGHLKEKDFGAFRERSLFCLSIHLYCIRGPFLQPEKKKNLKLFPKMKVYGLLLTTNGQLLIIY